MGFLKGFAKIAAVPVAAVMVAASLVSCGIFSGNEEDCQVRFEISEDKKSVTFYADADGRAFEDWQFYIEDEDVVTAEKATAKTGFLRTCDARKVSGLKKGECYISFYIPASKQEYTVVKGFNITVDALLQLTVTEAESDSMIGKQ